MTTLTDLSHDEIDLLVSRLDCATIFALSCVCLRMRSLITQLRIHSLRHSPDIGLMLQHHTELTVLQCGVLSAKSLTALSKGCQSLTSLDTIFCDALERRVHLTLPTGIHFPQLTTLRGQGFDVEIVGPGVMSLLSVTLTDLDLNRFTYSESKGRYGEESLTEYIGLNLTNLITLRLFQNLYSPAFSQLPSLRSLRYYHGPRNDIAPAEIVPLCGLEEFSQGKTSTKTIPQYLDILLGGSVQTLRALEVVGDSRQIRSEMTLLVRSCSRLETLLWSGYSSGEELGQLPQLRVLNPKFDLKIRSCLRFILHFPNLQEIRGGDLLYMDPASLALLLTALPFLCVINGTVGTDLISASEVLESCCKSCLPRFRELSLYCEYENCYVDLQDFINSMPLLQGFHAVRSGADLNKLSQSCQHLTTLSWRVPVMQSVHPHTVFPRLTSLVLDLSEISRSISLREGIEDIIQCCPQLHTVTLDTGYIRPSVRVLKSLCKRVPNLTSLTVTGTPSVFQFKNASDWLYSILSNRNMRYLNLSGLIFDFLPDEQLVQAIESAYHLSRVRIRFYTTRWTSLYSVLRQRMKKTFMNEFYRRCEIYLDGSTPTTDFWET